LLADWLPWAGLVAPGVVLNKDGSFQRTARFRGPDLDSATQGELIATSARLNNALRRLGSGWALFIEAERQRPTIRTPTFPNRCPGWWMKNAAPPSRNRATTSRAAIT
jgi:type IV secretory pathway VirB4 component